MFSSQQNQSSYQSAQYALSDFTHAVITAFTSRSPGIIRYKDLVDWITDWFSAGERKQTPFFVIQSSYTDVFGDITEELKTALAKCAKTTIRLAPLSLNSAVSDSVDIGGVVAAKTPAEALIATIRSEALQFCTQEQMYEAFVKAEEVATAHEPAHPLTELFDRKVNRQHLFDMRTCETIAAWFKDKARDYFVDLIYEDEEYEATVDVERRIHGISAIAYPITVTPTPVTRYRKVLRRVEHTEQPPFEVLSCLYVPKTLNLHHWRTDFALFFSKKDLVIFQTVNRLRDVQWKQQELPRSVKWLVTIAELSNLNNIGSVFEERLRSFDEHILRRLGERYGIKVVEDKSATDTRAKD
jgi:hypothetical protein